MKPIGFRSVWPPNMLPLRRSARRRGTGVTGIEGFLGDDSANSGERPRRMAGTKHDPENWVAVFRTDHVQKKSKCRLLIQTERIKASGFTGRAARAVHVRPVTGAVLEGGIMSRVTFVALATFLTIGSTSAAFARCGGPARSRARPPAAAVRRRHPWLTCPHRRRHRRRCRLRRRRGAAGADAAGRSSTRRRRSR